MILKGAIEALQDSSSNCSETILKQLQYLVLVLQGLQEVNSKCQPSEDFLGATEILFTEDIPVLLLAKLEVLDFQSRAAATNLCCILLQPGFPCGFDEKVLGYFSRNESLLELLLQMCMKEKVSTCSGIVLLSCLKHELLAEAFVKNRCLFSLLDLVQHSNFQISTDAFSCLREVLLKHVKITGQWLREEDNLDKFFRHYNGLITCNNYVVQRQAIKLWSDFLLDRNNTNAMVSYVTDDRHLRVIMNLLRDHSRTLRYEAFHLFKLFAANPDKPARVQKILTKNQQGLLELISNLESITSDDEQFSKDKKCVIDKIQALPGSGETLVTLTLSSVKLEITDRSGTSIASTADTDTDETGGVVRSHLQRHSREIMSL